MKNKTQRKLGFRGEYLWEFEFPEQQLELLAEAVPAERYGWRPVDNARSVSEVLIHIAAGNFVLLHMTGVPLPPDVYLQIEGEGTERFYNLIARNEELEKTITEKTEVVQLLKRSIESAREAFTRATDVELDRVGEFFGEQTTVRRVHLRLLIHMNEHMGQMVAYVRSMGMPAPWPAWRRLPKR